MTENVISQNEAEKTGLSRYFTGKPCKRGHIAQRFTKWRACIACHDERNALDYKKRKAAGEDMNVRGRRSYLKNKEKRSQEQRVYRENNREKERERYARYRMQRHDQVIAAGRKYREENPDRVRVMVHKWAKENPDKVRAAKAARRAAEINAVPKWSEKSDIAALYNEAIRLGLTVDHIIPLRHPRVCGLHVMANLQLLSSVVNSSKGNRFE